MPPNLSFILSFDYRLKLYSIYISRHSQVIDETLRVVTFSLMVFREAKKNVNVCGKLHFDVLTSKYMLYHLDVVKLAFSFRLHHS